jgi:hypothetical protein
MLHLYTETHTPLSSHPLILPFVPGHLDPSDKAAKSSVFNTQDPLDDVPVDADGVAKADRSFEPVNEGTRV